MVKLVTMVDLESFTASLKVVVKADQPLEISFQGETRIGQPVDGVITEDFYLLCISLWDGVGKGNLYAVRIDGVSYSFGLRTIGLDSMRGFFLNAVSYPLDGNRVSILPTDADDVLLSSLDQAGQSCFVAIRGVEDVERMYNHPSILGWVLPSFLTVEELKALQRQCFAFDKTRPSALLLEKSYTKADPLLRVTDLLFFSPESGGTEEAVAYHKAYPYRCVGTLPGKGDKDTRFLIVR